VAFPAFLDACVLVPITLADTLLRLAEAGTYRPLWSPDVLEEVERNLPKLTGTTERAHHRVSVMRDYFPDALVTDYQALVPSMTNHQKDRHVLAAAVRAGAAVIVTANLIDFPATATDPYDINVMHPDDFLLDQLDLYPDATVTCVGDQIAAYRNPAIGPREFFDTFAKLVPNFSSALATHFL
jgi:predicted nucleic acid-binding protein